MRLDIRQDDTKFLMTSAPSPDDSPAFATVSESLLCPPLAPRWPPKSKTGPEGTPASVESQSQDSFTSVTSGGSGLRETLPQ
ncbi:hypothetical protein AVEN_196278-1 [Araneus ventricosus]|uniref:Uncharacterized protein n=1 Tax=Araneus ventricosus TaxID=182803 RepID=A0A4Y2SV24_ARAVE|nr:hypothetical protein AVEN_196278-1 [Araneus ventricosus]